MRATVALLWRGQLRARAQTGTTVYDRLGARPVVNCRGVYSELGGAIISPDVWAAMTEAAGMAASMAELLDATGRRLAQLLGAEAARVTPGGPSTIFSMVVDAGPRPR